MTEGTAFLTFLSLAALGIGAWTYRAFRRDLAASEARLDGASRIAATALGACEYAEAGEGLPLLIAHGAGGGFDQGMGVDGVALAKRGFRVIAMSRFGYLRTPLPADASAAAQADAYAALMSNLGVQSAAILGASAGAPSALQFAIRHKERCAALILLVPMAYCPDRAGPLGLHPLASNRSEEDISAGQLPAFPYPALAEKLLLTIVGSDLAYWLTTRIARNLVIGLTLATPPKLVRSATPSERARVDRIINLCMPVGRRARGILNDTRICTALPRYELEAIHAPTLVMSCRDDRYGSFAMARYTAEQIAGSRFLGYDTGGHVWVGRNDEILDEMEGFLKRVGSRA